MSEVLFCPFCRESFEGALQCPEHELTLVPWTALPTEPRPTSGADRDVVIWYSPRLGRGLVAAGAVLTLIAMTLPLAHWSGQVEATLSLWAFAEAGHLRLWLAPGAAVAQLSILYRRRSAGAMRGARLVTLLLACVPSAMVWWALREAQAAVDLESARTQMLHGLEVGPAAYITWASALPMLIGAARLGAGRS
jgi:hypothetical protein